MTKANKLTEYSDAELDAEIAKRKNIKHQRNVEARREEQRIFNLPENVKAREDAQKESSFKVVMVEALRINQDCTQKTHGIWKIFGEDPNCDLGGPHHSPYLGKVEGTLEQAVKHAIDLPGFFNWGGGGSIVRGKPEKITKLSD